MTDSISISDSVTASEAITVNVLPPTLQVVVTPGIQQINGVKIV